MSNNEKFLLNKRVIIQESEISRHQIVGTVIEVYHGTMKVNWDNGSLGIYGIYKNNITIINDEEKETEN